MSFKIYQEKIIHGFDLKNTDEDIGIFINNYCCDCKEKIILPSGLKYCKQLVKALSKRFREKEIFLAKKTVFLQSQEQKLKEIL